MLEMEKQVREEIALRLLRETLVTTRRIAHWTGLSEEQVHQLGRTVKRLEGILEQGEP